MINKNKYIHLSTGVEEVFLVWWIVFVIHLTAGEMVIAQDTLHLRHRVHRPQLLLFVHKVDRDLDLWHCYLVVAKVRVGVFVDFLSDGFTLSSFPRSGLIIRLRFRMAVI